MASRVLALACKKLDDGVDIKDIDQIESDLIFLGLIGLETLQEEAMKQLQLVTKQELVL